MEVGSSEEDEERERERERKLKLKKRERNTNHQREKRKKTKLLKNLAKKLLLEVPAFDEDGDDGGDGLGQHRGVGAAERVAAMPESIAVMADEGTDGGVAKAKKKKKGKRKRGAGEVFQGEEKDMAAADAAPGPADAPRRTSTSLLDKMRSRLQGSQFRWLNERLYTCSGDEAYRMMQKDAKMFDNYHSGFQLQTEHWPVRPVDAAIAFVERRKVAGSTLTVADFGCGDAELAAHFSKAEGEKVVCHSFDLVSRKASVVACNMADVPLDSSSCDIAIFCLALMGCDYPLFLREARRCLRSKGLLWIAEVRSRYSKVKGGDTRKSDFVKAVCTALDCKLLEHDNTNKMFVTYVFQTRGGGEGKEKGLPDKDFVAKWPKLSSCVYKKR